MVMMIAFGFHFAFKKHTGIYNKKIWNKCQW